ncbi:MAG TPA: HEAT repeat domain-containing protein [Candidatus Bathyarchaeia archaeon]|nr:HEAT repeat domain-containing protein [Candidatus Bathyarchaeia archaeon]
MLLFAEINLWVPIVTAILGIAGGLATAIVAPTVNDWRMSRRLRKGLYRELVNWYENAMFHVREHNGHGTNNFFKRSKLDELLVDRGPKDKILFDVQHPAIVLVGRSILEAEKNPQIWRIALIEKLIHLRDVFSQLNSQLLGASLYLKTLENEEKLKLFYQLPESAVIAQCYQNFLTAFNFELTSYDHVPTSRFLTANDARQLAVLEAGLDYLKIACLNIRQAEDSGDLEGRLLQEIRGTKTRGTIVPNVESPWKTDVWCPCAGRFGKPVTIRQTEPQAEQRCESCKKADLCQLRGLTIQGSSILMAQDQLKSESEVLNNSRSLWEIAVSASKKHLAHKKEVSRSDNAEKFLHALTGRLSPADECAATALISLINRSIKDREDATNVFVGLLAKAGLAPSTVQVQNSVKKINAQDNPDICTLYEKLENNAPLPKVQTAAIRGIGEIRKGKKDAGEAQKFLIRALKSPCDSIVEAAAIAIGSIGGHDKDRDDKGGDELFDALKKSIQRAKSESDQSGKSKSEQIESKQIEIVKALGRFGEKSIQSNVRVLRDRTRPNVVRIWAAYTLANVGTLSTAGVPLTEISRDASANYRFKEEVERALTWMSPEDLEPSRLKECLLARMDD